jgi:hypothetical protein
MLAYENVPVICVLYHVCLASHRSLTGKFVSQQAVNCFFRARSTIFPFFDNTPECVFHSEVAVIDIQAKEHLPQAQRINEEENETRAKNQGHNRSKARTQEAV